MGSRGDTAAILPGLKLGIPFFFLVLMWTIHMSGSYHLVSQAGWDRCNLLYSTLLYSTLLYSTLLYSTLLYSTLLLARYRNISGV